MTTKELTTGPADFTVLATDPGQMVQAQKSLILWAARKIQAEKELLLEAQEQRDIAIKNKWRSSAWKRRVRLSERKIDFYRKIKMALEAGYYIVPPFPLDIFAVRTNQVGPQRRSGPQWDSHQQSGRTLPAGEGQYVSDLPIVHAASRSYTDKEGESHVQKWSYPVEFQAIEFPFATAKPAVLEATAAAMAKKIFDRVGVLPGRPNADPIICGQIVKPGAPTYQTPLTFFVAWWLDTDTI